MVGRRGIVSIFFFWRNFILKNWMLFCFFNFVFNFFFTVFFCLGVVGSKRYWQRIDRRAGRGGNTFLICWGVEGRRLNGQVGAERVWDGRSERNRSYFVLILNYKYK